MSPIVLTGMAVNTTLGDSVNGVLDALLSGRNGIGPWSAFPPPPAAAKVGGDLSGYDIRAKAAALDLPKDAANRLDRLLRRVPWSAKLSLLVAADAAQSGRYWDAPIAPEDVAVLVAGHNFGPRYALENWQKYQREPDYIDALFAVHMLDTNHAACVSELLGSRGAIGTVGASCASGNMALRAAMDELAEGAGAVIVVAPVYDYAPTTLQSLGMMGATTEATDPARASRPFDVDRAGFAPAHGAAAMVLETLAHAQARGAPPLAELVGVEAGNDACHRPPRPAPAEQAALILRLLQRGGVSAAELDLVSAHAASTPVGDLAEAKALALALGEATDTVMINAPKSMLGHCGWSSSLLQAALLVAQLRRGIAHGTANLDAPDPALRLPLAPGGPLPARLALNNAFGFGGLSCVSLLRRME